MNCLQFQKYVSAFADGELDVEKNLDALEHLNMCPQCAQRVADIQQMKVALKRALPAETAPPTLAERILRALDDEMRPPISATTPGRSPVARNRRNMILRLEVILGAAAVLIILLGIRDSFLEPGGPGSPVAFASVVSEVQNEHRRCASGDMPQLDPTLPTEREQAARFLCDRMGLDVRAPDLADCGFEFVRADCRDVMGKKAAHLLYRSEKYGSALSLFFLPELVTDGELVQFGERPCARSKGMMQVVMWNEGKQSCVSCACGGLRDDVFREIAQRIQISQAGDRTQTVPWKSSKNP